MFRRFPHWFAAAGLAVACGPIFAAVDVNAADEAALRSIKGIGPAKARALLDERDTGGPFRDASDLAERVKGFGGQALERLQAEGLAVGSAATYLPAAPATGRIDAVRDFSRAQARPAAVVIRQ
jgi:competence protein ComEA